MNATAEQSARPLTIVHVVFSSRIAGGERHCIDLAQAQARAGHTVHVVGSAGSAIAGAVGPDVRFHGLHLPLLRGLRLRARVRRLRADVCHGHLGPACKAVAAVVGAARIGTLHVGYKAHQHAALDGLICVNSTQKRQIKDYRGLSRVIYNWAPSKRLGTGGDLRAELGLGPERLLVGSVGRLHKSKGMDLLVSAFKTFAPADADLVILGEGEDMPLLQRLAAGDPRIRLLGFREDVDAALRSLDLFVSPSREEAFPLAILEAMRAGLPVVSSATQGPQEMLARQPGRLVPVGDVAALGRAIADSLAEMRARPRAEREKVVYDLTPYDRDHAVAEVIAFYRTVMAALGQPPGAAVARPEGVHA